MEILNYNNLLHIALYAYCNMDTYTYIINSYIICLFDAYLRFLIIKEREEKLTRNITGAQSQDQNKIL